MRLAHAAVLLVAGTAACGSSTEPPPNPFAVGAICSSGLFRGVNESESELMMPGHGCIACHSSISADTGEDAPIFRFAGTLYPSGHEPDDCLGSEAFGAQVWVTDATGLIFSAAANRSGNFMLETRHAVVPPFAATVHFQGRERAMGISQPSGDCNSCHTQDGDMGAPGRIVLP